MTDEDRNESSELTLIPHPFRKNYLGHTHTHKHTRNHRSLQTANHFEELETEKKQVIKKLPQTHKKLDTIGLAYHTYISQYIERTEQDKRNGLWR